MTERSLVILKRGINNYMFCIPILASNTEDAIKKMSIAARVADVLEVRLDLMESFDIPGIIMAAEKPVLITCRSVREGGKGKDRQGVIADHLLTAIESGADMVDLELSMPQEIRKRILKARGKSKIVISTHIHTGTPSTPELEKLFNMSNDEGADIVKIVTLANEWEDNLRVLELVGRAKKEGVKIISFCMGPLGRMSRVFSVLMGAYMTFASLGEGQESAVGQISVEKMKEFAGFFSV
jgi:3-dehydroquinate dehydratase type I